MPRKTKASSGWDHYFPIPRGHAFEVTLVRPPLPVRGRGTVVSRTGATLHLRLEVPGGFLIPSISADVTLTYAKEGGGNSGRLEVTIGARRESFADEDVAIHSSPSKRTREIAPSLSHRGKSTGAVLRANGEGECRISTQGWEIRLASA